MTINKQQAYNLIRNQSNSIFSVSFKKKDGTQRNMVARLGVKKHLKGGSMTYNPSDNGYVVVFDMSKAQYRTINTHTLTNLKANGNTYTVRG